MLSLKNSIDFPRRFAKFSRIMQGFVGIKPYCHNIITCKAQWREKHGLIMLAQNLLRSVCTIYMLGVDGVNSDFHTLL